MFKFSNWGPEYRGYGIVAPGGNTLAAYPGGGTVTHKGTSVSAPIVSGVAALLASLRRKRGLPSDPLAVRDALVASARPCTPEQSYGEPERCLAGTLDVPGATRLIVGAAPTPMVVTSIGELAQQPSTPLVYALGVVGYDFGTEARRDSFKQTMAPVMIDDTTVPVNPYDARQMVDHLQANPSEANALIWTLNLELTPIYALEPVGAYAASIYELLTRLLEGEVAAEDDPEFIERVAVPGRLSGRTTRLFSGQTVPIVEIDGRRGLYGWEVNRLAGAAVDAAQALVGDLDNAAINQSLREFLTRVYYDLRNLGATSRDRAMNFAATNAFQAAHTIASALASGMALDTINVEKSPFCRMDSDCWDVKLRFFDPENSRRAKKVSRFTIDVSDTLPVTLGEPRTWLET
jgi:cyanobactin maturation PatA/PatG family protease